MSIPKAAGAAKFEAEAKMTVQKELHLASFLVLVGFVPLLPVAHPRAQPVGKYGAAQETPPRSPDYKTQKQDSADENEPCPGSRGRTGEARFADYVVRTYRDPNPYGCFEILRQGKQVYAEIGFVYQIGGSYELALSGKTELLTPIGTDVTGLGVPDVVVGEWTGGAHCCFVSHVFELGPQALRKVATIDSQDSDGAHFEDVDHDGRLEFLTNDWTFAYWRASFADSPAPDVVLHFRAGRFRVALDFMRKPAPSLADLQSRATALASDEQWKADSPDPPSDLWKEMLDLIYTGNAQLAWRFINMAWPGQKPGKAEFLKEFKAKLQESPYWKDLQELNRGQP
jgi:hypothetical protein